MTAAVETDARRFWSKEPMWARLRSEVKAWGRARGRNLKGAYGEELLRYKQKGLDGHPGQWIVEDLDDVLLGQFPAKVIVESGDEIDAILEEVKSFLRFLAETGRLHPDSDDPDTLCSHVDGLAPVFQVRMGDPSRYAWGKRMLIVMASDGVDPRDDRAVSAWMERFNALPLAERSALLASLDRREPVSH